jgi:hypothetical protein
LLVVAHLVSQHTQQMESIGMIGVNCQDGSILSFRLEQETLLMVL